MSEETANDFEEPNFTCLDCGCKVDASDYGLCQECSRKGLDDSREDPDEEIEELEDHE